MNFDKTWNDYWQLLYSDIDENNDGTRGAPLLAHYTSLQNLENILSGDEVWLSNPLFMNDLEEVRFGINAGVDLIYRNNNLRDALGTEERSSLFYNSVENELEAYGKEHVLDLYVMCFSVHEPSDFDGRLSMWRGYGANGSGAALVIDLSEVEDTDESPLALSPVTYATNEQRKAMITKKIDEVSDFIKINHISDERIGNLAQGFFQRLCVFAVFSKHVGFSEEKEWRLVYFKDRDPEKKLAHFFDYSNGEYGLHPKLKLKVAPLEGALAPGVELSRIIDRIIIGPSSASPIAKMTGERMLRKVGKEDLTKKLHMSSIPLRGDK